MEDVVALQTHTKPCNCNKLVLVGEANSFIVTKTMANTITTLAQNNATFAKKPNLLNKIATNVLRLCDGGEIEAEKLNLLLMFNQGTNVCFSTKAPLLQNRCYVLLFYQAIWKI